jgi:glycosyltransferase involved in cell wall biosynthesis
MMNNKTTIDLNAPLVSVCVTTYQHANFIEQCLDSILMQETSFPFEIIIGEDDSTDGTRDICIRYADNFKDKIRLLLHDRKNVIYIHGIPTGRWNFVNNLAHARGKYVAVIDGDDYWSDKSKLQKQVDFLESHPDYVISYHNASIVDEDDNLIKESKLNDDLKKDFSAEELISGKMLLTLTICFRNIMGEFPDEYFEVRNGDKFLTSLLGGYGKGKYQPEIKNACYRVHSNAIWSNINKTQQIFYNGDTRAWLERYYRRIGKHQIANFFKTQTIHHFKEVVTQSDTEGQSDNNMLIEKIKSDYTDIINSDLLNSILQERNVTYNCSNVLKNETEENVLKKIGDWSVIENNELHIDWILTRKCNYTCSYCTVYNNETGSFVPFKDLTEVIDHLSYISKDKITLSLSGGEPTLHPHYLDFIEYILSKLNKKVHIRTQTNLSKSFTFFEKFIDKFKENLNQISFSTSYHFEFAKKDDFLKKIKFLANTGLYVIFKICAEPDRMEEVKALYNNALEISTQHMDVFLVVVRQNYGAVPDPRYSEEDLNWLSENYNKGNTKLIKTEFLKDGKIVHSAEYFHDELTVRNLNNFKGLFCNAGLNLLSINADGSLDPAVCFRKVKGKKPNVYKNPESINSFTQPVICPFDSCYVPVDMRIPKYSKELSCHIIQQNDHDHGQSELLRLLDKQGWQEKLNLYKDVFCYTQYLNTVDNPKVSIVVISWRLHQDTIENFKVLEKQRDQNFELVFVDNGGKQGEFDSLLPFINTYVKLNKNTCAYLATNTGALFATVVHKN